LRWRRVCASRFVKAEEQWVLARSVKSWNSFSDSEFEI
jgi:hypothetical protein